MKTISKLDTYSQNGKRLTLINNYELFIKSSPEHTNMINFCVGENDFLVWRKDVEKAIRNAENT